MSLPPDPAVAPEAEGSLMICCCVEFDDILDTTACELHPVECEAIHPVTGHGCQHAPGHTSENHSYLESWPNLLGVTP